MDINFRDYWSEEDKQLYRNTDWQARDYEELPVENDTITGKIYFYGVGSEKTMSATFMKMIRSNPIYPPYYKPIKTSGLTKIITEGDYVGPMYDGHNEGHYQIHDRYETQELYDMLSD